MFTEAVHVAKRQRCRSWDTGDTDEQAQAYTGRAAPSRLKEHSLGLAVRGYRKGHIMSERYSWRTRKVGIVYSWMKGNERASGCGFISGRAVVLSGRGSEGEADLHKLFEISPAEDQNDQSVVEEGSVHVFCIMFAWPLEQIWNDFWWM